MQKTNILVVCGPTASGKTDLALHLAEAFGGEMIGADSMQVYKGLPVGTAALTQNLAKGVPQHLVGFLPPENPYSVAEYVADAGACIQAVAARGRLPVVCGGTGLYISSLVQGTIFTKEKVSPGLRESLQQKLQQLGSAALLGELAEKDPGYAATLHPADEKRIVRGLEQLLLTGKTYAQRAALSRPQQAPYRALCLGIEYPREILYARIEQRVEHMLQNGLLQEALLVYNNRKTFKTAAQAIGYKEFFPYFEGQVPVEECLQKLKQATRNYAKRQLTWFKHMPEVVWLNGEESAWPMAEERVRNFLV